MSEENHQEELEESKVEAENEEENDEDLDQAEKLPFPTACIVRLMKANLDGEKMIKKDVKIAMNKWLGGLVNKVSKEINKLPYTMIHLHEFEQAKRKYEDLEEFDREKQRILAHLDAIKKDIERLERDLGKKDEDGLLGQ